MPSARYGEGSVYYDNKRDLWVGQILFGTRRRRVTGRKKSDMLIKMRALQREKDEGLEVPASGTVGAFLDYWLRQVARRVSGKTLQDYSQRCECWVKPYIGHLPLSKLEIADVEAMMTALEDRELDPTTVRLARGTLRQALGAAVRAGKCRHNVAALAEPPRARKVKISDRLSADEVKVVLKTLLYDRLYALAVLALSTGMRPIEMYNLRWSEVDLRAKVAHVSKSKTPAGVRDIALPEQVVEVLRQHQADSGRRSGFVFVDEEGRQLKHRNVTDWWHAALAQAGISRRRFYCTRHTAATLMLNHGVALEVVSKTLGHASYAITADIYAEVGGELQRQAAEVMDSVLGLAS